VTPRLLILAGLILPLALDTFALCAALGAAGIPESRRLRTALILSAFEGLMPVAGMAAGAALGHVIGDIAAWAGIAVLAVAGMLALRPEGDDGEERRLRTLGAAQGVAIIGLGLAISVDELTVGLSAGLLSLPLALAVLWIAVQAFAAAQLGLRMGARVGESLRERMEKSAGVILLLMAVALAVLKLTRGAL
jgi:putative Mn2+ efflux pump MntP